MGGCGRIENIWGVWLWLKDEAKKQGANGRVDDISSSLFVVLLLVKS